VVRGVWATRVRGDHAPPPLTPPQDVGAMGHTVAGVGRAVLPRAEGGLPWFEAQRWHGARSGADGQPRKANPWARMVGFRVIKRVGTISSVFPENYCSGRSKSLQANRASHPPVGCGVPLLAPPPPLRCDVSPNDVVKFVVMDKDLHKEDDLMCSATVKGRQLLTRVCAPAAASVRWRSCGDDWVCRSGWSSSLTQIHPYPVMILTIFKNIF